MQDLIAQLMSKYLEDRSQDEWLYAAVYLNYDANGELLRWMISHDKCDKAVALAIYWYSGPRFMAQYANRDDVPSYALDSYDLVIEIERRFLRAGYASSELQFDPRNDDSHAGPPEDWTKTYENEPLCRIIPEVMKNSLPGRRVDFESGFAMWTEGMPPTVWDEYEALLKTN